MDEQHHGPSTAQLVSALVAIALLTVSMTFYFNDIKKYEPNSRTIPPPIQFLFRTTSQWRQVHMYSQVVFQGVVYGGTLFELVSFLYQGSDYYQSILTSVVPILDHYIALPSLAMCSGSGVVLVRNLYLSKRRAVPQNVHTTVILLNVFGVYWVIADKVTQNAPLLMDKWGDVFQNYLAQHVSTWLHRVTASKGTTASSSTTIFWVRLCINIGSCAITYRLWWLMCTNVTSVVKQA